MLDTYRYKVDFREVKYYMEIHEVLKRDLEFPDYYGGNLDALWDCLTDMLCDISIIEIYNSEVISKKYHEEWQEIIKVFKETKHAYTVEIVIGSLIAVQLARHILIRAVKLTHPCTFNSLNCVGENHRAQVCWVKLLANSLLEPEIALRHLVRGLIAGPGELYRLLEARGLVVNEIERAFAVSQNVLRCV